MFGFKSNKQLMGIAVIAAIVAAVVVYASNNVDTVEDVIG